MSDNQSSDQIKIDIDVRAPRLIKGHDIQNGSRLAPKIDLSGANFERGKFDGIKFNYADMGKADLSFATFYNCDFQFLNLSEANFKGALFDKCYFSHACLNNVTAGEASFCNCEMQRTNFTNAKLIGASFSGQLYGANFKGADLTGAYMGTAIGNSINFTDSFLRRTELPTSLETAKNLIIGPCRDDGYRFYASVYQNKLYIKAGCRYFPIDLAREHWECTRGDPRDYLGQESFAIIDLLEKLAKQRGWKWEGMPE